MFESCNSILWHNTSRELLWLSHPAWPSVEWQTYSWDYETFGSYYGSRKACEPVHIQMNLHDNEVVILNTTMNSLEDVKVEAVCMTLDGNRLDSKIQKDIDVDANSRKDLFVLDTAGIKGVFVVRLTLSDKSGKCLSTNDYLIRGEGTEDFKALAEVPAVELKARKLKSRSAETIRFEIINPSKDMAMNLKFNLRSPETGEIILPAYFSDGYFHLMPGEKRIVEMSSPETGEISVEGYNVESKIILR